MGVNEKKLRLNGIKAAAQKHYESIEFVSDKNCDAFLFKLKGYINFIGQVRGNEDDIYSRFLESYLKVK